MRLRYILFIFFIFWVHCDSAKAWRKWEYVNPSDLEIRVRVHQEEIVAGSVATFTISIRNKTDKTIPIYFPTGQQYDYAIFHNRTQIYRWSQGLCWDEAPHSVPLKAGKTMEHTMAWNSVDRLGRALPQGHYAIQGMVMTKPRYLVTNQCKVRLLPKNILKEEIIETKLGHFFEIELPRYTNSSNIREHRWKLEYLYNDNRVSFHKVRRKGNKIIGTFKAKRRGYVRMQFFLADENKNFERALQRRSYKVVVK